MDGETVGAKIAHAAKSISATILSPAVKAYSSPVEHPWRTGFRTFLNASMVDIAHNLGVKVIPWTVNELQLCELIALDFGVDGIITDYPTQVRRWAKQQGFKDEQRDEERILTCLVKHTD